MNFEKNVMFLGVSSQQLTKGELAGRTMYNVQLFDQESNGPVGINVMDGQPELESVIGSLSFGVLCTASFDLRPDNGKYRIRLQGLTPVTASSAPDAHRDKPVK